MTHNDFDLFLADTFNTIQNILSSKSADYSGDGDKLFNFKQAARLDGITPVEALRGMHLKHRCSISQGLDELSTGKVRPKEWWDEKLFDTINYYILLKALLEEEYFGD